MTAAELARLPLRRVRPAKVIRAREMTQPIVFVLPSRDELATQWAAYLRGRS